MEIKNWIYLLSIYCTSLSIYFPSLWEQHSYQLCIWSFWCKIFPWCCKSTTYMSTNKMILGACSMCAHFLLKVRFFNLFTIWKQFFAKKKKKKEYTPQCHSKAPVTILSLFKCHDFPFRIRAQSLDSYPPPPNNGYNRFRLLFLLVYSQYLWMNWTRLK